MKTRSTLLGLLLAFGMLLFVGAAPESALAQCGSCTPPTPPCCVPTPPCNCTPPAPPQCCAPGHNINIPSVNVNVASTVVVNASAGAVAGAGSRAGAGSTVFYGGGGGGGGYAPPMASGVIQGLNVEGQRRMKRSSYEASRSKTVRVVIQAFCMDDREIPHPASQVTPDRDIDDAYDNELYRCIAGTRMQATIAEYTGKIDFAGGKTLACRKNDALYHAPGGKVECRPQRPARDCNERSLLRRFGAGIKILTMVITETYTAYREEEESSGSSAIAGAMSLDGGVGGISY
jgi:hypothetical protein